MIEKIYLSKEIDKKEFSKLKKLNIDILRVDNKKAQAMSNGGNHQGIIAEISAIKESSFNLIKKKSNILLLVGLTDIGNIGAIFRTAYSLGVEAIIITGIKELKIAQILRVSSGAMIKIPFIVTKNSLDVLNELKQIDFDIYAGDMKGEDVRTITVQQNRKRVLLVGNEEFGIPKKVLNMSNKIVSIKMDGDFNSLNVGVATAILLDRLRG